MRIKMTTLLAGPSGVANIGDEIDVDDETGRSLVDGNYAIEIKRRDPETATRTAPETTQAEQAAAGHLANIAKATPAKPGRGRRGQTQSAETETPAPVETETPAQEQVDSQDPAAAE